MSNPLYHAVDGDGRKLVDAFGNPLLVRKLHQCPCCRMFACEAVKGDKAAPLWFYESALREIKPS